ncbi:hypothetical protein EIP91_008351 [Steccherinum ochraceum]|uniref:Uncharacterized protein n=1 Tax=Steccherinum ochraceum TaxID=92696 RepID=A0A4R0RYC1_9APHY|nr:hypothetical protein EIP91_008351 [Steccherinum ochraceum]
MKKWRRRDKRSPARTPQSQSGNNYPSADHFRGAASGIQQTHSNDCDYNYSGADMPSQINNARTIDSNPTSGLFEPLVGGRGHLQAEGRSRPERSRRSSVSSSNDSYSAARCEAVPGSVCFDKGKRRANDSLDDGQDDHERGADSRTPRPFKPLVGVGQSSAEKHKELHGSGGEGAGARAATDTTSGLSRPQRPVAPNMPTGL